MIDQISKFYGYLNLCPKLQTSPTSRCLATRWPSGILIRKSQVSVGNIMSPLDMIWSGNKWNNIRRSIADHWYYLWSIWIDLHPNIYKVFYAGKLLEFPFLRVTPRVSILNWAAGDSLSRQGADTCNRPNDQHGFGSSLNMALSKNQFIPKLGKSCFSMSDNDSCSFQMLHMHILSQDP